MRRIAITILLVALFASFSLAQSADAPSREDVLKLMQVLNVRQQVGLVLDGMSSQIGTSMSAQMKKMAPNATPRQQKLMDELAAGAQQDMRSVMKEDEMIELMVPIYQKYMTKQEVAMITNFYSTPEGQAFLKKMPMVMRDAMQAGGEYGRSKQPELEALIQKRLADFKAKLTDSPADTPKKPSN